MSTAAQKAAEQFCKEVLNCAEKGTPIERRLTSIIESCLAEQPTEWTVEHKDGYSWLQTTDNSLPRQLTAAVGTSEDVKAFLETVAEAHNAAMREKDTKPMRDVLGWENGYKCGKAYAKTLLRRMRLYLIQGRVTGVNQPELESLISEVDAFLK